MLIDAKAGDPQHPEGLTALREELATQLFDIGTVKVGGNFQFVLHEKHPDAPSSPVYFDLRILRRFPETKKKAIDVYEQLFYGLYGYDKYEYNFDLLADVPTAATPLVASLSDRLMLPMITPRMDAKVHGTGAKVDGLKENDKGKTAVLIDDVVTHADSKLEAARILRENGIVVNDVVVLIDYEKGGRKLLETEGLTLRPAMTINQLLDFYLRVGKIGQDVYQDAKQRLEILDQFLAGVSNS